VLISSDKAVWPSNVMGASKRVAEQLLLSKCPPGSAYSAVRFGNVLGSRGSVIPTFTRQIASGGPVTVTDPRMTRFFMSVEEAVQLVLQASLLSEGRDIFMLEMGEPVSIMNLARRMIELSGARIDIDIPIKIVGIRPGEKLQEDLREPEEEILGTEHPFISRLIPISAPEAWFESRVGQLAAATLRGDGDEVRHLLFAMAGTGPDAAVAGLIAEEGSAPDRILSSRAHFSREPAGSRPEATGA
jgi:FlaA1/EpsC-like NDP-sugar epimerase